MMKTLDRIKRTKVKHMTRTTGMWFRSGIKHSVTLGMIASLVFGSFLLILPKEARASAALVQQATFSSASSVSISSAPTAGNALILTVAGPSQLTAVSGGGVTWELARYYQSYNETQVWIGYNASGSGGTSISWTGGSGSGNVSEWSGFTLTNPFDKSATDFSGSPTEIGATVTPTGGDDYLIYSEAFTSQTGTSFTAGPTNGFTALDSNDDTHQRLAYFIATSTGGSYGTTWTIDNGNSTAIALSFKLADAGTPADAIEYAGSASTPDDGGSATGPTQSVTPPIGMQAGDLVLFYGQYRGNGNGPDIDETGGQTWTLEASHTGNPRTLSVYSATFNGTWTADPSMTDASTLSLSLQMHVYRGIYGADSVWTVDDENGPSGVAAEATPTLIGIDPTAAPNVSVGIIATPDDNTFSVNTLGNWSWPVGAYQYRNIGGSDQSATFLQYIQNTTHAATGDAIVNEATSGNDAYTRHTIAFVLTDGGGGPPDPPATSDAQHTFWFD